MKKWPFFAIILPSMARYGSETSFLLIFSARDDLVKVSCKSDARKCQNQVTLLTLTCWVKGTSPFTWTWIPSLPHISTDCIFFHKWHLTAHPTAHTWRISGAPTNFSGGPTATVWLDSEQPSPMSFSHTMPRGILKICLSHLLSNQAARTYWNKYWSSTRLLTAIRGSQMFIYSHVYLRVLLPTGLCQIFRNSKICTGYLIKVANRVLKAFWEPKFLVLSGPNWLQNLVSQHHLHF